MQTPPKPPELEHLPASLLYSKPDKKPQERAQAASVALNMGELGSLVIKEMECITRLDKTLEQIERVLLDPEVVERMNSRELRSTWEMVLMRKDSASRFVVKLIELGVKANVMGKLFGSTEGSAIPMIPFKETVEIQRMKALIKEVIGEKTRQGE